MVNTPGSPVEWVIRMATTGKPKTVHHVSTVEVLADTNRRDPGALIEVPVELFLRIVQEHRLCHNEF